MRFTKITPVAMIQGLLFLTLVACNIETDTFYSKVKITGAYVFGDKLDLVIVSDQTSTSASSAVRAPNLTNALELGGFTIGAVSKSGEFRLLNRSLSPEDPSTLTLLINPSVDLGSYFVQGGFMPNYEHSKKTVFSFSPDQARSLEIPAPVYLLTQNIDHTESLLISAFVNNNEIPMLPNQYNVSHLRSSNGDLFSISFREFESIEKVKGLPVYLRESQWLPGSSAPDHTEYVDFLGNRSLSPIVFDPNIRFEPGTLININNCDFGSVYYAIDSD